MVDPNHPMLAGQVVRQSLCSELAEFFRLLVFVVLLGMAIVGVPLVLAALVMFMAGMR